MTSEPFELILAAMALVAIAVLLLRGPLLARDVPQTNGDSTLPRLQVGQTGIAISYLRPGGKAQFGSRILDVLTDGEVVKKGRQVSVIEQIDGDTYVREVS